MIVIYYFHVEAHVPDWTQLPFKHKSCEIFHDDEIPLIAEETEEVTLFPFAPDKNISS